jgi:alpha-1,3-rhamnosyltransferase
MESKSLLVSVIISSFNSGKYIIETLESIGAQTWPEIELIITDDCSKDDTLERSREWLSFNHNRLANSIILTSPKNTGVAANANRGLKVSKGDWIKFLGADDALKPDCIEKNMAFINWNPDVKILFSKIEVFRDTLTRDNMVGVIPGNPFHSKSIFAEGRNANSQYKMLLVQDRIHFSPSAFIHKNLLDEIGGFDEDYKFLEDYPLWVKLTRAGHKLFFMDLITVSYRMHSGALNNNTKEFTIKPGYYSGEAFRKRHTYPFLPLIIRLNQRYLWIMYQIFRLGNLKYKNRSSIFLHNIFTVYINPFRYIIYFRKLISPKLADNEFYC